MTNKIVIREARNEDAISIQKINLALGYDYDIASTTSQLLGILESETAKIFVAIVEDHAVGYIHGSDYHTTYTPPLKDVIGLAVLDEYQGCGIGRKLLERLEQWAKDDGSEGVRLVSGFNRLNAHKFYISCGYKNRKDQKNFWKIF
ncbi:MAG: GNAT family N-acetyltransferase [Turicibacter sp.]|nr:GNAT family N-acetyltransferase [Turicibacter sp.]